MTFVSRRGKGQTSTKVYVTTPNIHFLSSTLFTDHPVAMRYVK